MYLIRTYTGKFYKKIGYSHALTKSKKSATKYKSFWLAKSVSDDLRKTWGLDTIVEKL